MDGVFYLINMDSKNIEIKNAKLSKGGCVEATYIDLEGNEICMKGKHKCHSDLKVALSALVPYFADLTEQKEADRIDWDNLESAENVELLRKLNVTGLSIGGGDANRFITMTGNRTLMTSRVLNLNSPGVEMDSETFEWTHIDDFDLAVQGFIEEVKQYILDRKWEVLEPSLFDGDPDDPFGEARPTDQVPDIEHPADVA